MHLIHNNRHIINGLLMNQSHQWKKNMEEQNIRKALVDGNQRFLKGANSAIEKSMEAIKETSKHGQKPFAIVLTCSDSRVVPEYIFDMPIGSFFTIRTAGEALSMDTIGSIEYAYLHLHVSYLLILSHTNCGAVGAALEKNGENAELKELIDEIKARIKSTKDYAEAVKINGHEAGVEAKKAEAGLLVDEAVYDISNGKVSFIS